MSLRIAKLKKSLDFKLVISNGLKFYSSGFFLFCTPYDEDLEVLKIGFTASKRLGCAVKRNRCKRLMRSLAAEVLQNNIRVSAKCVMIARPQLLIATYHQLKEDTLFCAKHFMRSIDNPSYAQKFA